MTDNEISVLAVRVTELMRRRLQARGADLAEVLRHRGGRLPRKLRREASILAEAELLANHPRLQARLDQGGASRAGRALITYLEPLGQQERRRRLALSILGGLAAAMLAAIGLVLALLIWRGVV